MFECVCDGVGGGLCVHMCVCVPEKKREGGWCAQDAFASASGEKVSAALFTVGEPERISVISVIDTVSHTGEGRRGTAEA